MSPLPKLRDIEIFPIEADGKAQFVVRDPLEIQEETIMISPVAYFIAAHLDGKNEAKDIQASFARYFDKQILPSDIIEKVVKTLDELLLLDNDRSRARAGELNKRFSDSGVRPSCHAGAAYEGDPDALALQLSGFFRHADGPGPVELKTNGKGGGRLVGLVSPHIDFGRGGPCYAWAYQEVLSRPMADLYVVLGVAHVSPPAPFVMTKKDFETPLGTAPTDKALVDEVAGKLDWDPFAFETVHRKEHSIEFQTVFLRWCGKEKSADYKVAPILVSGVAGVQDPNGDKPDARRTFDFLKRLADAISGYQGRVCLVAGVDLAHVGRRFGDDFDITQEKLDWIEKEDQESIEATLKKDPDAFQRSVLKDGINQRKVCGLGALYAFNWLMRELHPKAQGTFLRYGHAPDPAGGEVSFASLSFVE